MSPGGVWLGGSKRNRQDSVLASQHPHSELLVVKPMLCTASGGVSSHWEMLLDWKQQSILPWRILVWDRRRKKGEQSQNPPCPPPCSRLRGHGAPQILSQAQPPHHSLWPPGEECSPQEMLSSTTIKLFRSGRVFQALRICFVFGTVRVHCVNTSPMCHSFSLTLHLEQTGQA